jgi:NCAIR mutase (PurE)-related protein
MSSGPGGDREGIVNLGFARVDSARRERCGRPEVIFGAGKTAEEIARIASVINEREGHALATRLTPELAGQVSALLPEATYHARARCLTLGSAPQNKGTHSVAVLCAGTSDLPVAEEATITLQAFGRHVESIHDVGVAGIHRLLAEIDRVRACSVVIVVAGMEGALPSAVAGLVEMPVIAVPTSVGYGASFEGLAALLGMVNSCANGVTVTNIDNGFGAACAADAILRLMERESAERNPAA